MNQHVKKEVHEKNRKRHKQQMQEHARELARRGRSPIPVFLLVVGIGVVIAALVLVSFW
jgi:nucleoside phosphorylase